MSSESAVYELLAEAEALKKQVVELQEKRSALELQTKKKLNSLFDRVDSVDAWATFIHDLADLPGTREPKWYRVSIPFEYGDQQERFSQVQISPTGPFVCTQMQAYYKITDTDPTHYSPERENLNVITPIVQQYTANGRTMLPTSYFGVLERWLTYFPNFTAEPNGVIGGSFSSYLDGASVLQRGDGWNYPEFDLRIQTASNESFWTGLNSIPMACVFGSSEPLYISRPSIVKATDSLVVYAKPSIPTINLTGSVEFVFHGYQINAHLNLEQLGV